MDKEFEANFNIFLTFHRKANKGIKFLLSDDKKWIKPLTKFINSLNIYKHRTSIREDRSKERDK